jgi:hypothetical protein
VTARKARSHRVVLFGLVALLAAALGGMWFAFEQMVDYERRAVYHVPEGAQLALRVDLEQVVLFEPVRRHVFPVLGKQLAVNDGLKALERHTGIRLAIELREVMAARQAQSGAWVFAVGGLFPERGVLEGLARLAEERGLGGCNLGDGMLRCPKQKIFVTRADDGILLLGSSEALVASAREVTAEHERLGLLVADAAGFAVEPSWLRALAQRVSLPGLGPILPGAEALEALRTVSGSVELGTETTLTVRLTPVPSAEVTALETAVRALLQSVARFLSLIGYSEVAGERSLLAAAIVKTSEDGAVEVTSRWTREDIDRGARSIADWLTAWGNRAEWAGKIR